MKLSQIVKLIMLVAVDLNILSLGFQALYFLSEQKSSSELNYILHTP